MGEGAGNEALLMPFIHSANIACGYHAGDEASMQRVVELCLRHKVNIGAHPSFPDRENFGRTEMLLSSGDIQMIITGQLSTLNAVVKRHGARMHHVKPHGALYNMAAKDAGIARAIARAVKDFDPSLVYYGLSGSIMISIAEEEGLQTASEVFADRTYQADGTLTPRSQPHALITGTGSMMEQLMKFIRENKVTAVTGEEIYMRADTVCIHGDGTHAVEFAKVIHKKLNEQ